MQIEIFVEGEHLIVRSSAYTQEMDAFAKIPLESLSNLSFTDATKFVGERVCLFEPTLREMFKDYLWSADGTPPKKS